MSAIWRPRTDEELSKDVISEVYTSDFTAWSVVYTGDKPSCSPLYRSTDPAGAPSFVGIF